MGSSRSWALLVMPSRENCVHYLDRGFDLSRRIGLVRQTGIDESHCVQLEIGDSSPPHVQQFVKYLMLNGYEVSNATEMPATTPVPEVARMLIECVAINHHKPVAIRGNLAKNSAECFAADAWQSLEQH